MLNPCSCVEVTHPFDEIPIVKAICRVSRDKLVIRILALAVWGELLLWWEIIRVFHFPKWWAAVVASDLWKNLDGVGLNVAPTIFSPMAYYIMEKLNVMSRVVVMLLVTPPVEMIMRFKLYGTVPRIFWTLELRMAWFVGHFLSRRLLNLFAQRYMWR